MTTRSKRFSVVVLVLLVVLYGLFAQPMTERKVSQDKEYLQTYFQISPLPSLFRVRLSGRRFRRSRVRITLTRRRSRPLRPSLRW